MKITSKDKPFSIEREGNEVAVIIGFPDEYGAIEFYDRLIEGAERGELSIHLVVDPEP